MPCPDAQGPSGPPSTQGCCIQPVGALANHIPWTDSTHTDTEPSGRRGSKETSATESRKQPTAVTDVLEDGKANQGPQEKLGVSGRNTASHATEKELGLQSGLPLGQRWLSLVVGVSPQGQQGHRALAAALHQPESLSTEPRHRLQQGSNLGIGREHSLSWEPGLAYILALPSLAPRDPHDANPSSIGSALPRLHSAVLLAMVVGDSSGFRPWLHHRL